MATGQKMSNGFRWNETLNEPCALNARFMHDEGIRSDSKKIDSIHER